MYLGLICRTQLRELLSFFTEDYDFIVYLDEDFVPPSNMRVEFGPNELICPSKNMFMGDFGTILQFRIGFHYLIGINWA